MISPSTTATSVVATSRVRRLNCGLFHPGCFLAMRNEQVASETPPSNNKQIPIKRPLMPSTSVVLLDGRNAFGVIFDRFSKHCGYINKLKKVSRNFILETEI